MLEALGVPLERAGAAVTLTPVDGLRPFRLRVPGDISSAAFLVGAALLGKQDPVVIREVGVNPTRAGVLRVLERMGARVDQESRETVLGEPLADLVVHPSRLRACEVTAQEVPSLIDEVPLLAVLASRAQGPSVFRGVAELRVKESDRLELMARNLRAVGVKADANADTLWVEGGEAPPTGRVDTAGDHRLAMAFAVLGTVPGARIRLSETASVAVSYPGFFRDLASVTGKGEEGKGKGEA
jgi:3-phosphoshikimate 1-carboxyvinyltransferase